MRSRSTSRREPSRPSSVRTAPARPRLFNAISRQQELSVAAGSRSTGTELTKLSPANAARLGMARTFQDLRIFVNMSVLENVLVGCHRHERSGFWSCCLGLPRQRAEERRSRERAMDALGARRPVGRGVQTGRQSAVRSAAPGGDSQGSGLGAPPAHARRAGGGHERVGAGRSWCEESRLSATRA